MFKQIVAVLGTAFVTIIMFASPATADVITPGPCRANNTELAATQAPGQTGNGPLVVLADGTAITPPAFQGWYGC